MCVHACYNLSTRCDRNLLNNRHCFYFHKRLIILPKAGATRLVSFKILYFERASEDTVTWAHGFKVIIYLLDGRFKMASTLNRHHGTRGFNIHLIVSFLDGTLKYHIGTDSPNFCCWCAENAIRLAGVLAFLHSYHRCGFGLSTAMRWGKPRGVSTVM